MGSKRDYWDIPLKPEHKEQLDQTLMDELNEKPPSENEDDGFSRPPGSSFFIKALSLMLAITMIILVLGRLFNVFSLPSLEFITGSRRLSQIPEIQELQQAVVSIEAGSRRGTGFNIHPAGVIVTNFHVIRDAHTISVSFPGGLPYQGVQIAGIPQLDLALLSIKGASLPVLKLDDGALLETGDNVLIIGNPLGLSRIISEGEIAGYVRLANWDEPVLMIKGPVHSGSSGSPVFNEEGLVVAVIFATLQQVDGGQDEIIGLAVTADKLTALLQSLPEDAAF